MSEISREFRKHRIFGEIYAVEAFADGEVLAALKCTRPEQLTRGALAVITLDSHEDWAFVNTNENEFDVWNPPMVKEEHLAAIIAAERACEEGEQELSRAQKDRDAAKKTYEKACELLRRVVREAASNSEPAPLLVIAERPDPGRSFDGDDGDDRNQHPDELRD